MSNCPGSHVKNLMASIVAAILVCLFSACGTLVPDRRQLEKLGNPQSLHDADAADARAVDAARLPVDDYYAALKLARQNYQDDGFVAASPENVRNYVEEGIALVDVYCRRWFDQLEMAQRRADLAKKDFNIISQLGTALLGLGRVSPDVVTGYGALGTFVSGYSENASVAFLLAPTTKNVRDKIMQLLMQNAQSLRDQADASDPALSFKSAYVQLERHAAICTYSSARQAADSSLEATDSRVMPSGRVISTPSVASVANFLRDDAGTKLRSYWKPDGRNANADHEAALRKWLKKQNLESVSLTELLYADQYAARRAQAASELLGQ